MHYDFLFCLFVFLQITRKIIRKFVSADGVEREEVTVEGDQQKAITVENADSFSKVIKRTVVKSTAGQMEVGHGFKSCWLLNKKTNTICLKYF